MNTKLRHYLSFFLLFSYLALRKTGAPRTSVGQYEGKSNILSAADTEEEVGRGKGVIL